ncbi:MAG TPA: HPr-rel-A system PqqD family peptide chaperone [Allosphingosinicella sp.]|jgi:PqqD family protein of HPr-rel-A system
MAGPRFVADPSDQLRAVPLETLTAVYHAPSGMTHLLAPPAPQILAVLADRPGTAEDVLERIAEQFDVEAGDASEAMASRLAELETAGLVRKV